MMKEKEYSYFIFSLNYLIDYTLPWKTSSIFCVTSLDKEKKPSSWFNKSYILQSKSKSLSFVVKFLYIVLISSIEREGNFAKAVFKRKF